IVDGAAFDAKGEPMARRLVFVAAAALLSVVALPTLAHASTKNSLVGGGVGTFHCGPDCTTPEDFGLGITGGPGGSAKGEATASFTYPGVGHVIFTIRMTCLDVEPV